MGKRHIRYARSHFPDSIISIFSRSGPTGLPNETFSDVLIISEIDEAIKFDPVIIIVATPSSEHLKNLDHFINKNINFFIEKPISSNLSDALKFRSKVDPNKNRFFVSYNLRFLDSLHHFRSCFLNNIIKKLVSVRVDVGFSVTQWRPGTDYTEGISVQKRLGGGVLLELSHEIDYIIWIFGYPRKIKYSSVARSGHLNIDVDDCVVAILEFVHGDKVFDLILTMDFLRHNKTRKCEIIGQDGTLIWDGTAYAIEYVSNYGMKKEILHSSNGRDEMEESYINEWLYFKNRLMTRLDADVSLDQGITSLRLCEELRHWRNVNCD